MSSPARTIDSNDPRLTEVLYSPDDPPNYINPIALAVHAAGFTRRALRIEECGKYKSQKCEDGHITRRHRWCGTRACTGQHCAQAIAGKLVEAFEVEADHYILNAKGGSACHRFTFVDYRFKCEHNRLSINAQATTIIDRIMQLESVTRTQLELGTRHKLVLWAYTAGLDDSGLLVIRVLFLDDHISPEILRGQFGSVSADVHIVPAQSIHKFFPLLFGVAIPKDPALASQMEIAFMGIRRLRTIGQYDKPEVEELLVEEGDGKTLTNNSELADDNPEAESPPKKHKSCPICHKRIVEESGWMPGYLPPPLPERTTFYPTPS